MTLSGLEQSIPRPERPAVGDSREESELPAVFVTKSLGFAWNYRTALLSEVDAWERKSWWYRLTHRSENPIRRFDPTSAGRTYLPPEYLS